MYTSWTTQRMTYDGKESEEESIMKEKSIL